ncbi:MAG: hypothetical protein WAO83_11845, partial [Fuerstiella sp.]
RLIRRAAPLSLRPGASPLTRWRGLLEDVGRLIRRAAPLSLRPGASPLTRWRGLLEDEGRLNRRAAAVLPRIALHGHSTDWLC